MGYRVGGRGIGSGASLSYGLTYNFKHRRWSDSVSSSIYASCGPLSLSASISISGKDVDYGLGLGLGCGNDAIGVSILTNYSSKYGWSLGCSGYYNPHGWDSNPRYEPEKWNDGGFVQENNNCYSYALNDPNNCIEGMPQPGDYSGECYTGLTQDAIIAAAIADGKIKKPTLWNKLGFGKKGYYSVCLVLDIEDNVQDYHWYRQDKGGYWSQKHGTGLVENVDGSGHRIINPSFANHYYGLFVNTNTGTFVGVLNYTSGPYYLWVKAY